jgi:hypothetical protein
MKLIIAGSRDVFVDTETIGRILESAGILRSAITEVVSGGADGIDTCGEKFAEEHEIKIKVKRFLPDWSRGKRGGPERNRQMADYADVALVIMKQGGSRGSQNMIEEMQKLEKRVVVIYQ